MTFYLIAGVLSFAILSAFLLPLFFPAKAAPEARKAGLALGLLIAAGAFGFYATLGSPQLIAQSERYAEQRTARHARLQQLSARLTQESKNPALWLEIGDLHLEEAHYPPSVAAYRQAVLLTGGAPEIILRYAKALALQAGGKITPEVKKSLEMVLLQQPGNPEARFFLIVHKAQSGQISEAKAELAALLKTLPPASPLRARIRHQLGEW